MVGSIVVGGDVVLELGHEERGALGAAALVADGVLDGDLVEDGAVVELDEEGVTDGAALGVVVLGGVLGLLNAVDLGTEGVDARVSGRGISAIDITSENGVASNQRTSY